MTLSELVPALARFSKIIVTGPQRSGTTIATKMLAAELEYPAVLEESFREQDLIEFGAVLLKHPACVVQAPALSAVAHLFKQNEVAVVFMLRRTEDIRQSEQRINWLAGHDKIEKAKYFATKSDLPISVLKTKMWNQHQKPLLGSRAFELEYESLASHPLWVEQDLRRDFGPRQTERLSVPRPSNQSSPARPFRNSTEEPDQ
jgi:hypothetical protein